MKVLVSLAATGLLACAACATTPGESEAHWKSAEIHTPSDRVLWQIALLSLQSQGYPLASGTDSGSRQVESGWKTDLQPFRKEGRRSRATVRMSAIQPELWKVEVRVRCENNDNMVSPLDPSRANWKPAPDDDAAANILLMHIRARLKPELPAAK